MPTASTPEDDQIELSGEDLATIAEADAAIDRGEFEDFHDFAARMRRKFCAAGQLPDGDE